MTSGAGQQRPWSCRPSTSAASLAFSHTPAVLFRWNHLLKTFKASHLTFSLNDKFHCFNKAKKGGGKWEWGGLFGTSLQEVQKQRTYCTSCHDDITAVVTGPRDLMLRATGAEPWALSKNTLSLSPFHPSTVCFARANENVLTSSNSLQ